MIIRCVITHIGMTVFGLALFFATNLQSQLLMLFASIFSAAFYGVILYSTMWEYGAKDKPAFDAGRRTGAAKCGFFASLIAETVWIILALAIICSSLAGANSAATVMYGIEFLFNSCFTGIEVYIKNNLIPYGAIVSGVVYILGSLIISAVGAFGYVLGTKDITIIPKKANAKK